MKLAWLTKLPNAGQSVYEKRASHFASEDLKGFSSKPLLKIYSGKSQQFSLSVLPFFPNFGRLFQQLKDLIFAKSNNTSPQSFLLPDQKRWQEQVKTYAESPFEESLFNVKKRSGDYPLSRAWAEGIKSSDPVTRDSAIALIKAYISYHDMNSTQLLSPHTQMKLMLFAPHLTEGPKGKAILYEAVIGLPINQLMEFEAALRKDFSTMPPVIQAVLLKQIINRRKGLDKKDLTETEATELKKLIKSLVIGFYTMKQDSLSQTISQRIHLGFLKIQPIEEAYHKKLEEIERRYRLKLRQLKKRRSVKVAEAEEERMRLIELIYDGIETNLISGLNELNLVLDHSTVQVNRR